MPKKKTTTQETKHEVYCRRCQQPWVPTTEDAGFITCRGCRIYWKPADTLRAQQGVKPPKLKPKALEDGNSRYMSFDNIIRAAEEDY